MNATVEQKKLTDCYWFLQNQCVKGSSCEYRHNEAVRDNTSICKFWIEGKCLNQNCIFRHPSGVQTTKQIVCFYFTQGKCTKGDNCPYLHPLSNEVQEKKLEKKEEELKLQLESKREEEKLMQLRIQAEIMETEARRKQEKKERKQKEKKSSRKKEWGWNFC